MSKEDQLKEHRQSHPRVLVVTNDFPPTLGGIQTYVRDYLSTLNPESVVVFASTQNTEDARAFDAQQPYRCLLYTSPSPRDRTRSRMPSSA